MKKLFFLISTKCCISPPVDFSEYIKWPTSEQVIQDLLESTMQNPLGHINGNIQKFYLCIHKLPDESSHTSKPR